MAATEAAAKAVLFDLLAPAGVPAVAGITYAYRCDPGPGRIGHPVALMVFSARTAPHAYFIAVRLAVSAEVDAEAAQDALSGLHQEIDMIVMPVFGPGDWEHDYDEQLEAWTSTSIYEVPRDDGHLRYPAGGGLV
jgi:hypothetical protein